LSLICPGGVYHGWIDFWIDLGDFGLILDRFRRCRR
jgi:hypothetical protein